MLMCRACKERQRKCAWQGNNLQKCVYCTLSNRDCIPFREATSDLVKPIESTNSTLQYWHQEMVNVEMEMCRLQHGIRDCYAVNVHSQEEPEWQLAVENGQLRLLSDIKTLQELSLYGRSFSKYLCPLQGFLFHQLSPIKLDCEIARFDFVISGFRFIYQAFSQSQPYQLYKSPPLHTTYGVNPIIDKLVNVYVKYQNSIQPVLHVPTFLEHYRHLKDPLSCPITLAICTNTICSTRRVKEYSSIDRRQLADFFFSKCKSMLLEMFDDPKRRLDTLIIILLLNHYIMIVLLDFTQARRLSTIAVLLCNEMESVYGDVSTANQVPMTQRVMFERVSVQTAGTALMMDIIYESQLNDKRPLYKGELLKALPDEDQTTHDYLELYSHVLHVSCLPSVTLIMNEMERAKVDVKTPSTFSVEHILRFDEAIRKWWSDLPDDIRLCDDPLDSGAISRSGSVHKLLLYGYMHSTILLSYGAIIKPLNSLKMADGQNTTLSILYDHCVVTIIQSLERMLSVVLRILSIGIDVSVLTIIYLIRSVHTFHNIFSSAPDIQIPLSLEQVFTACMKELNATVFPSDNSVLPTQQSPLKSYMATRSSECLTEFAKYPLPGYAFAAEIFNTASAYFNSRFQGTSTADPFSFVHFITDTPLTSVY